MVRYKNLIEGTVILFTTLAGLCACSPVAQNGQPMMQGQGQSLKRDAWGHRPGPSGYTTVIIDAGHGGHDSGARGYGQTEKIIALDTAQRLKRMLSGKFKVVMVRSGDRFVDLDDRVAVANRYQSAVMVSLHYNASPSSSTRGPETYFWRVDSHGLARRIQWNMEKVAGGNRSRGLVRRRLRLTRNPQIPCVLVEFGYLSNRTDAKMIASSAYREKMAAAVASALLTQRAVGDAGTGPRPKPLYQPLSKATDPPGS
ncbi:hypothetical protein NT6N_34250 [Oceaniferula spumae]|uniref:N-acetylmuramoyl-L-alanine amidase n=1 Tax=Oceaniferula spumae TaxID=2979115 RepID=A0AAT9FQU6_9BACT